MMIALEKSTGTSEVGESTWYILPQILASTADAIKNFAVIYLVDIGEVPDFNTMYELYDPCTCMFFFRNKARSLRGRW